jgi:hypothetical protein
VLRVLVGKRDLGPYAVVPLIAFLLALTSALAILIHLYFEKPVMGFLRRKLTFVA